MILYTNYSLKVNHKKIRQIKLFDIPLLEIESFQNGSVKKHLWKWFPLCKKQECTKKPVMYLKINKTDDTSLKCLQQWIDVAYKMENPFYILCDKKELKQKILKNIIFQNKNVYFLQSNRGPLLTRIVKNLVSSFWKKATYAHLTTFFHTARLGIDSFWNIDADDTAFLCQTAEIASILQKAQEYAVSHKLNALSLDMHTSRSLGKHWSFGITYIQNNTNWLYHFSVDTTKKWQTQYTKYDPNMNLDWFMTHLREKGLKNEVFYVENLGFIHWGNFITNPINSSIWYYENGKIIYPLLRDLFQNKKLGEVNIWTNSIQLCALEKNTYLQNLSNKWGNIPSILHSAFLFEPMTTDHRSI